MLVYQVDYDTREKVELQELSDFDPYKLTSVEIPKSGSDNALSIQVGSVPDILVLQFRAHAYHHKTACVRLTG